MQQHCHSTRKINASKCDCGMLCIPQEILCPVCRNKMKKIKVDGCGIVKTYTIAHVVPMGFTSPLKVALICIDEGLCIAYFDGKLSVGERVYLEEKDGLIWIL